MTLTAAYCLPLYRLAGFAFHSDLYSHILLIPFIGVYLAYSTRDNIVQTASPDRTAGFLLLGFGAALAVGYLAVAASGLVLQTQDYLACLILSFVFCIAGLFGIFLGAKTLRALAFPLGFLVFMAPLPLFLEGAITDLLQEGSAATALMLFRLCGTPVFYTHLVFKLPGILIEVAPECSGIHSSLVLFITSVLAGFFFLRSPSKRAILALVTLPLAIFRNGFRILIIGELCVRVGPDMINSYIHRRGGPFFFALSLIPFSALLWWLWRSDRRTSQKN